MLDLVVDKMWKWLQITAVLAFAFGGAHHALAADGRFDLVGPKIDVRVTRGSDTLPIASVPNLQPGDRLWLHPDLPPSQSVKYLLICVFLRGTTNPPPEDWFYRIETWNKKVQQEGTFITVPAEAQQAVLFMAPETGGDFTTLKAAVRGRPGVFVRASQDLSEAGFEQARIERFLADIRRVPPSDAADLQRHSDLLARTLNLKPNPECFKRPMDQQFACLTQTGSQLLLDDGHAQNVVASLSSGASSDFISQASYTQLAGAGSYSAYVGAVVDLIRIMSNLHTAQYQYIPAIAFPQGEALNLRLNTPPSFRNPKSVLVIGLPSIQQASKPPLQAADPNYIACLLKPSVVLPLEGAPLVFSTDFATEMVLHLNTPPGAPVQPDIPLISDAFEGGLRLDQKPEHHVQLTDIRQPLGAAAASQSVPVTASAPSVPSKGRPVVLTGTIQGRWGFDPFTGPTLKLQQLPGSDWHIVGADGSTAEVIAGKTSELFITSSGSACVHNITEQPAGTQDQLPLQFKPSKNADHLNRIAVTLPSGHEVSPGSLHLTIQQYGQPQPDIVQTRTFSDPAHIAAVEVAAGDRSLLLGGTNLGSVTKLTLGDLVFRPDPAASEGSASADSLRLSLASDAAAPPTHAGEHLTASVTLNDGRELPVTLTVAPARPSVTLLGRTVTPPVGTIVNLSDSQDLPLDSHLDFTLKSGANFPRNGEVEIQTLDGTLRAVLTLAPSGGLILQDPHTVVASLDPLRSFGPSAFGALRVRAVFPAAQAKPLHNEDQASSANASSAQTNADGDPLTMSDWLPLGTLVRLPVLTHLQCASDPSLPCNLSGTSLYLLQAVSADPAFAQPDRVPDGFTGTTLQVPHPAGSSGTLFLKLRDDPTPIDTAMIPTSILTPQAVPGHAHGASAVQNR